MKPVLQNTKQLYIKSKFVIHIHLHKIKILFIFAAPQKELRGNVEYIKKENGN